jgi:transposase
MSEHNKIFVGIDVAKKKFDVVFSPLSKGLVYEYTKDGLEKFIKKIQKINPQLICMEATGGLERELVDCLHEHQFELAVVNPRQIRDFAKACGQLAKTDQIDARMIAQFGQVMQPRITLPLSNAQRKMKDLSARRRQLTHLLVQEKNRLATTADEEIKEMIQETIQLFDKQIECIELQQKQLIQSDQQIQEKAAIIQSVPGLGETTAAMLIAELPELGSLNREQIARLVGVAPTNRDSGTLRGKRTTGGGRVMIRNGLYMPTIVAKKHNPQIRVFYDRLVEKGKPKMVALIAAMRKLLTILNVMLKEGKKWNENKIKT